jgi:hypothetical protein
MSRSNPQRKPAPVAKPATPAMKTPWTKGDNGLTAPRFSKRREVDGKVVLTGSGKAANGSWTCFAWDPETGTLDHQRGVRGLDRGPVEVALANGILAPKVGRFS